MDKFGIKKENLYGCVRFGVINPDTNTTQYFRNKDFAFTVENKGPIETYTIPCHESYFNIDICSFLDKRYNLRGVVGYAVGKRQEEVETDLGRLFDLAGVVPLADEFVEDSSVFKTAMRNLDVLLGQYVERGKKKPSDDASNN